MRGVVGVRLRWCPTVRAVSTQRAARCSAHRSQRAHSTALLHRSVRHRSVLRRRRAPRLICSAFDVLYILICIRCAVLRVRSAPLAHICNVATFLCARYRHFACWFGYHTAMSLYNVSVVYLLHCVSYWLSLQDLFSLHTGLGARLPRPPVVSIIPFLGIGEYKL